MTYSNILLTSKQGINFSLSNEFPNQFELTDAIEDAKNNEDLVKRLRGIHSYIKTFSIDRVTESYVRIKLIANMCDNEYYLIIKF